MDRSWSYEKQVEHKMCQGLICICTELDDFMDKELNYHDIILMQLGIKDGNAEMIVAMDDHPKHGRVHVMMKI